MRKFKKVVVSLVLAAAMLVGGALSASAVAEQPVVPDAVVECSHINCEHVASRALQIPTAGAAAPRTICSTPGCGLPEISWPIEETWALIDKHDVSHSTLPCSVYSVHTSTTISCRAGHSPPRVSVKIVHTWGCV